MFVVAFADSTCWSVLLEEVISGNSTWPKISNAIFQYVYWPSNMKVWINYVIQI